MLNRAWLTLTLALIVAALLFREASVLLAALALLLAQLASWIWGRYALTGVTYERSLSEQRAFFGEQVTLDVRAANRKLLPLAWLSIEDEFPLALRLVRGRLAPSHKPQRMLLNNLLTLRWYERITRRYRINCIARGEHIFGPVKLRTGDVFGFVWREEDNNETAKLIVYPRVLPVGGQEIPSNQLIGLVRARRRIVEDPLRLAGIREYAPGDPMRRIHWKATARQGELQSKLLEPSTTADILLLLNVSTFDPPWLGLREDRLELAIITVASLANRELLAGHPVGLIANSNAYGADQAVRILPGRDPGQFQRIIEALARMTPFERHSFPAFLRKQMRNCAWGTTAVVVSGILTDELAATLVRLRRAGRDVTLVLVGDDEPRPVLPGIPVLLVSGEQEWRDMDAIALR